MSEEAAAEGGGEHGGGGGGGSKKLLIIIIAVVLLLIIGGGAAAFFLLKGHGKEGEEGGEHGKEAAHAEEEAHDSEEPLEHPTFLQVGTFVVNVANSRQYLKVTIQLMLSEPAASQYLNGRLVEVKDLVLADLQELTAEDLRQPNSKEDLRRRLISKISKLFPKKPSWKDKEPIRKLLFEEFFIQ